MERASEEGGGQKEQSENEMNMKINQFRRIAENICCF
jgi:hypothetical protein